MWKVPRTDETNKTGQHILMRPEDIFLQYYISGTVEGPHCKNNHYILSPNKLRKGKD